jgi:hypothetical protein
VETHGEPISVDDEHPFGALSLLREADFLTTLLGGGERAIEAQTRALEAGIVACGRKAVLASRKATHRFHATSRLQQQWRNAAFASVTSSLERVE